jgi:hypothetical protein
MARRFVALLLIGAWQLQGAVPPHFHPGMSPRDLIAHGERRHFHWPCGSHADHEHAHAGHDHAPPYQHVPPDGHPLAGLGGPLCGHDKNAVYLGSGSLDVTNGLPQLAPPAVATLAEFECDVTPSLEQHTSAPPRYGGQPPAFLATIRLLL